VFADPCVVVDGPECDLERPFYGYLGGESSSWYPDLIHDNHSVDPPGTPEDGYHLSNDLSDHAIRFIRDAKVVDPDKPFFLYLAPQAGHAPHHVFPGWADKDKGRFDQGTKPSAPRSSKDKRISVYCPRTPNSPDQPAR